VFCIFFDSFYEELQKSGLLQPLTCRIEGDKEHSVGTKHFIATKGQDAKTRVWTRCMRDPAVGCTAGSLMHLVQEKFWDCWVQAKCAF